MVYMYKYMYVYTLSVPVPGVLSVYELLLITLWSKKYVLQIENPKMRNIKWMHILRNYSLRVLGLRNSILTYCLNVCEISLIYIWI